MRKHIKRLITVTMTLVMLLVLLPTMSTKSEATSDTKGDSIIEQISDIYTKCKKDNDNSKFNGYCGRYVNFQIIELGIGSSWSDSNGGNGKDQFGFWSKKKTSPGSFNITPYSSSNYTLKEALTAISNAYPDGAYNILVSYNHGDYGHVNFIHAILDGKVYFSESFAQWVGSTHYNEGEPIVCSISKFCDQYENALGYPFIGAIHFDGINVADNIIDDTASVTEGTYYIEAYCGKVVEVADSRTSNKANVQIWENVGIDCQKFTVTKSGNYYTLTNVNSGKVLDIADGSSKSGTNIWQYGANGTDAQKWQFEDAGGGYYYIRSALGTYMDVYDGGTANGTNVWAYKFNGTNAQMFKLISVSESVSSGEEDISADDIVSVAKSLVGQYPYVSCGESPEEGGFDCTGLVYYIYHTRLGMNMTLNQARSKSGLLALGTKITNKADLLPGDVLQMQYSTGPHVVIYIGNNQIVEAAKPGTYVRQQSFSNISSGFEYGIRFPQVKQSKTTSSQPYSLTIKYNANGGSITSNTYSATSSGMIQKGSSDVAAVWPYGYGHESGLYNASTFGLIREGYVFVGWSLSRDGTTTIYDQDDASIRAETIYPELRNGDATITLYAIWEKQYGIIGEFIESVSVNVNGSTVTVHWMSYPYATSYYVRISDNTHVVYESGALPGTINEYSFTNIANGQYSASVELYTSGVAGIAAGISDYFIVHTQGIHFTRTTAYKQGQYTDVPVGQWFTSSVADAFELGLMKGNSATTFNPYGDVTLAEAITMASRIHSIYYTGTENFNQNSSGAWYQTYLDYAYNNGIINSSYYNTDVNVRATRAQFAEILSNSLPDEALLAMNAVSDDAIPDVKMTDYYAQFVYRLYRAGILTGGDVNGTFSPLTYITRAEAATIISRMAESDNRIEFAL